MSAATTSGIRTRQAIGGVEVFVAAGLTSAYAPHAHDSYVVGLTAHGVQRFRYRGVERAATPGEAFVLHPGETHDGRPGSAAGFGYRALYIAPRLIGEAAGAGDLPFVAEAVSADRRLRATLVRAFEADPETQALAAVEAVAELSERFQSLAGAPSPRQGRIDRVAMRRIRERLDAEDGARISLADLEAAHSLSRFAIARQFRRCYGVNPSRYIVLRRLDVCRRSIQSGAPLADAAHTAGFADQSHMTRQFVRAYGVTPGRWRALQDSLQASQSRSREGDWS